MAAITRLISRPSISHHPTCIAASSQLQFPIRLNLSQRVEEFYRSREKLMDFDLPGGIPESWPKLLHVLNLEEPESKRSATA